MANTQAHTKAKKRIASGIRPTGPFHLGNLHGALANWKKLTGDYDCFFFVADWHAITTDYENPVKLKGFCDLMIVDWLAGGLDPEKCTFFTQSEIKEHAELFLLLSMITPVPWLERNPTYKDQIVQLNNKDLSTFGFLGYPVLQAADIILYKASCVPVGMDQVPHVEITREIARRFNYLYGEVFPEPQALLSEIPKILGTDRRKMGKSYKNAIYLGDTADQVKKTVMEMVTDPSRMRKKDPGNPEICNVFTFHKLYSDADTITIVDKECRKAEIGCVDCKKLMAEFLIAGMTPIMERRAYYIERPDLVRDIMQTGNEKARMVAKETMEEVRQAMKL